MKRENEWSLRKQIANRSKSKGNPDIGISKNFIVVIIYVLKRKDVNKIDENPEKVGKEL